MYSPITASQACGITYTKDSLKCHGIFFICDLRFPRERTVTTSSQSLYSVNWNFGKKWFCKFKTHHLQELGNVSNFLVQICRFYEISFPCLVTMRAAYDFAFLTAVYSFYIIIQRFVTKITFKIPQNLLSKILRDTSWIYSM